MWPPILMSNSHAYVLSCIIISCSVPFSAAHRTVGNFWETQGGSLVMQSVLGTLSYITYIMHKQTASQCFTIVWWNLFISDHPRGDSFWPLWRGGCQSVSLSLHWMVQQWDSPSDSVVGSTVLFPQALPPMQGKLRTRLCTLILDLFLFTWDIQYS